MMKRLMMMKIARRITVNGRVGRVGRRVRAQLIDVRRRVTDRIVDGRRLHHWHRLKFVREL